MKLHSPAFERRLKRAVRERLKASPKEVRKRAQESGSAQHQIPGDIIWHLFCAVTLSVTIASLKEQGYSTGLQLALISLVTLAQAFFYVPHGLPGIYEVQMLNSESVAAYEQNLLLSTVVFRRL